MTFTTKVSALTLGLLLSAVSFTQQSCATAKLPQQAVDIINQLTTALPQLMSQASNAYDDKFAAQARSMQDLINQAVQMTNTGNKKNMEVSTMLANLNNDLVGPFFAEWKKNGKLEGPAVVSASRNVNDALRAIKKAANIS